MILVTLKMSSNLNDESVTILTINFVSNGGKLSINFQKIGKKY